MFQNKLVTPIDFLIRRYKVTEQEAETMLKQSYEWWIENSLQENNLEDTKRFWLNKFNWQKMEDSQAIEIR